MIISARNLSRASKSSLNCSGCWSRAVDMKDLSVSISGTGFVRRNGMDRMFVAILACAAAVLVIGTTLDQQNGREVMERDN